MGKKDFLTPFHIFKTNRKMKSELNIAKGGIRHLKEIFEKLHYSITKLDRVFGAD